MFKTFHCNNCDMDISVPKEEAEGYLNWKCDKCNSICMKKDSSSLGIVWKCSKGTE